MKKRLIALLLVLGLALSCLPTAVAAADPLTRMQSVLFRISRIVS